jgi:hypothetical protein
MLLCIYIIYLLSEISKTFLSLSGIPGKLNRCYWPYVITYLSLSPKYLFQMTDASEMYLELTA